MSTKGTRGQKWSMTGAVLGARLQESGGFTYQPVTHASPTTGYALSILPGNERVFAGKVTKREIADYLAAHATLFEQNPAAHVGGWLDPETGKVYLDVSVVESDKDTALALARAHDQLAIYDLGSQQTIPVSEDKASNKVVALAA